ncbi:MULTISPECIES: hypothetical protein [unclassified Corynebacterium]|nr:MULTISPECIES: hypothetical protein [unclassified Corynebacterium]MDN8593728.1 hypothetical protein [Corynebacterium sp. P4_F2]WKK55842.1 hypothetical protein QYR03_00985 [Corynebacterium sp. P4-C1]WKK63250.1 hypothetical protein QYR04_10685 [Corynebacterium sp. P8-C1]
MSPNTSTLIDAPCPGLSRSLHCVRQPAWGSVAVTWARRTAWA